MAGALYGRSLIWQERRSLVWQERYMAGASYGKRYRQERYMAGASYG